MVLAILLLREDSSNSLKALVDRAQQRRSPLLEYDLRLNNCRLDFTLLSKPVVIKPTHTDEGFESDIDSLSIVSSDDSFTLPNPQENGGTKTTAETDSANGSASSDSDTESPGITPKETSTKTIPAKSGSFETKSTTKSLVNLKQLDMQKEELNHNCKESFNLVDCICYTDVKFPNILVFVIKKEGFVFSFDNLKNLQNFFTNFSALKAVTNQKIVNKAKGTTFNLLQRTDNNGITHIEITRETGISNIFSNNTSDPSSIVNLNTPEYCLDQLINSGRERPKPYANTANKESRILRSLDDQQNNENNNTGKAASNSKSNINTKKVALSSHDTNTIEKSASTDDLLDIDDNKKLVKVNNNSNLVKTWNSAENLLEIPKRPDRRKRVKYRAPQPPALNPTVDDAGKDILSGQFVRVNVNFDPKETQKQLIIKSHLKEPHPKKLQGFNILSAKPTLPNFLQSKPKLQTYQQFKYSEPKRIVESATLQRVQYKPDSSWTNSVPRLLKKQRSKSETRNFTPMAYRYIDTTQNNSLPYGLTAASAKASPNVFGSSKTTNYGTISAGFFSTPSNAQMISNRLFGLSPKLKEFGSGELKKDRWGSMNDICFKSDNNLKSVIKKDECRKKNEKKVTFSAYTTVQVV